MDSTGLRVLLNDRQWRPSADIIPSHKKALPSVTNRNWILMDKCINIWGFRIVLAPVRTNKPTLYFANNSLATNNLLIYGLLIFKVKNII